ncbi:Serine (or cysteine) peptidase inhibitor, clade A (alpha-1 antiproteinase, antitrypsin), member 3J [Apodemus speciosus]|uniref:Serine (Or cysteine) peptidase inhibitor, clade A (Alpha-1 antiproteinase, antitrypsin), member 3J n=1 Tax=Apodemus speciosus TaxID=105296 RepID=A0ABQ0FFE7_APOSI
MMKMEDMTTPYFQDEEMECTVVEMNYKGNNKAMFILPVMDDRCTLFAQVLHIQKLHTLENILPELGMKELFSTQADLSGITGAKDVRVSQMIHNTVLDMTEMGTKSYAVTRDIDNFLSAKINPTILNLNMPFLFWVTNPDSEIISFTGRVANPEQD